MADIASTRRQSRIRRHRRVRKNIHGTAERPRLAVYRSNKHLIGPGHRRRSRRDVGRRLVERGRPCAAASGATVEAAGKVGTLVAERAKAAGITKVVFDRGGFLYHGRIAAVAAAARDAGLEF